jgi:hypothetical protein
MQKISAGKSVPADKEETLRLFFLLNVMQLAMEFFDDI